MPKLDRTEMHDFLDERKHLLRLASIDADGGPRLVPVWFVREGNQILFTPRAESVFLANLRRDPRAAISIDEAALPYRKVSIQGTIEILHEVGEDDAWRDTYRSIARRYLDDEGADRYLGATRDQPRALLAIDLDRGAVTTWRMPVEDEQASGIWARRYYQPGSRLSDPS